MSVRIVLAAGTVAYVPPPGAVEIADVRSCFARLPEIEQAITDAARTLTVVVRDAGAASMLASLCDRPGVELRVADLRADLAARWHCPLPAAVTPEVIAALNLVEASAPTGGDIVGDALRRAYDDALFMEHVLDTADEAKLLGLLAGGHPLPEITKPLLLLLAERLRQWGERGSGLAAELAVRPDAARWFIARAILRRYPSEIRRAVERELERSFGQAPDLTAVPSSTPKVVSPDVRAPLEAALQPFLAELPLAVYLDTVSGALPIELTALIDRVADRPGIIELAAARAAFAGLNDSRALAVLDNLERRWRAIEALDFRVSDAVADQRPAAAFAALASFYTERYLAAKAEYASDPMGRERLISWNEDYGDWLVGNYHRLAAVPEPPFAADVLHRRLASLLAANRIPIVLLIDGLSWAAFLRLLRAAGRAGLFQLGAAEPCLAPLPTLTEVGMTALIAGAPISVVAQEQPARNSWREARERLFLRRFPGARLGRANNPTQISEALAAPAPIYLLHALVLDRQVHDPDFDAELLDQWSDVYFDAVCRALVSAAERPHLRERLADLVLVVATDHGYTDLLRDGSARLPAAPGIEPESLRIVAPHHSALEVTLPPAGSAEGGPVRRHLAEAWQVIEGDGFGLPDGLTWLLPRSQRRVRGGAPRVHGRSSLEETIVPLAQFSLRPQAVRLALAMHGTLIAGKECILDLRITNPATWPVRDVRVTIPDLGVAADVPRIDPGTIAVMTVDARPPRSGDLTVEAWLSVAGAVRQVIPLPVTIGRSEEERMLGDDRAAALFDEEDF